MPKGQRGGAKRSRPVRAKAHPVCPYCGIGEPSKFTAPVPTAKLIHSHGELTNALRVAGREMLQFQDENSHCLVRIREVLKAAESVREELKNAYRLPQGIGSSKTRKPLQTADPGEASETANPEAGKQDPDRAQAAGSQPKHRFTRPNSYRVLKFPIRVRRGKYD